MPGPAPLFPPTKAAPMTAYHNTSFAGVNTVAASGTAQTLPDGSVAQIHDVTLTGNCTFTFPDVAPGKHFRLVLRQDGTGSRLVTWPASVKWAGGAAPTLTTAASSIDVVDVSSPDGVIWVATVAGKAFA
jgi:hypothetical protein